MDIDSSYFSTFAVLLAISALVITWILHVFRVKETANSSSQNIDKSSVSDKSSNGTNAKGNKSKKKNEKISSSTKKVSDIEFSHKWLVGTLKGHDEEVRHLSFSPDNKFLASVSEDRSILVWNVKDFEQKDHRQKKVNIEHDFATKICWSPDTKAFLIAKEDQKVVGVYKVGHKSVPSQFIGPISPSLEFEQIHNSEIIGLGIPCNGKYIMSCSSDGLLILWSLKGSVLEKKNISGNDGTVYSAKISPCGRYIGTSGNFSLKSIVVYEPTFNSAGNYKELVNAFALPSHVSGIYSLDFNTDSSRIVTLGVDLVWRLFDTTGTKTTLSSQATISHPESFKLSPNERNCPVVAISHDAKIISVAISTTISIFSAFSSNLIHTISDAHREPISDVVFSSDDEYILSTGDRLIRVFRNVAGLTETLRSIKDQLGDKNCSQALKERLKTDAAVIDKKLKNIISS